MEKLSSNITLRRTPQLTKAEEIADKNGASRQHVIEKALEAGLPVVAPKFEALRAPMGMDTEGESVAATRRGRKAQQ